MYTALKRGSEYFNFIRCVWTQESYKVRPADTNRSRLVRYAVNMILLESKDMTTRTLAILRYLIICLGITFGAKATFADGIADGKQALENLVLSLERMIATAFVPRAIRETTLQNTMWVKRYPPGTRSRIGSSSTRLGRRAVMESAREN